MNSLPRQKLCELLARHGVGLCDDAPRCVSLLLEACPGEDRAIHVMTSALKERVAIDLRDAPASVPIKLTLSKLMKRLEVDQHLSSEVARWVVESWALALGKISEADLAWLHATSSPQASAPASKPGVPQPPRPARPQAPRPAGPQPAQPARPQPPPAARPHGAQPARPQPPPPARPHGVQPARPQPPPPVRPQPAPPLPQRSPEPPVPVPSQPAPKPSLPEPEPVVQLSPQTAQPAQKQSPEPSLPAKPVEILSSTEQDVLLPAAELDDAAPVVEPVETLPLARPAGNLQWVKTGGKLQIAKPDTKIPAAKLADAPSPVKASETPAVGPATKAAAEPDSTDLLPVAKSAEAELTPVVHPLATILAPAKHAPRRGAMALVVLAIVGVLLGLVAWWTFFRDWRGEAELRQQEARERQKKMEESSDPEKVPRWMRRSWKTLPN